MDWLPVAVLPPLMIVDAIFSARGKPIGVLNVLATVAACTPLVLRRRLSFVALAPLLVGGVVLVLWQLHPENTVVLLPMVGLFELALNGDRRRSLQISLAVVPCVTISVLPFASGFAHVAGIVLRNLVLCLLAVAAGDVLRSRRESAARALQAREQELLRGRADERLQVAREIHDVVAHAMTAINVQAGVAAHLLEHDPGQAHGALRHIKQTSGEALAELRETLDVLRDPGQGAPTHPGATLDDLEPLTAGLRSAGVEVHLDVVGLTEPEAVAESVHRAGYRIVQEALTNIARHAHAGSVSVSVRRDDGIVMIEVADDGPEATAPAGAGGNGLRGMRERAAALGGTVEAAPGVDGGWRVRARLPDRG
jgi:signal transduction histidine kinase